MSVAIPNNDNRNWFIWIIMFLFAGAVIAALNSCSCDYHYRKLNKKCPKVESFVDVKDTAKSKPIIDSGKVNITESPDSSFLKLIEKIVTQSDSTNKSKDSLIAILQRELGGKYNDKVCIPKPIKIPVSGGYIVIYQTNSGELKWEVNIPEQKIPVSIRAKCPDAIQVTVDYWPNWVKFVVITLLLLIIVGFVLKKIT